MGYRLGVDLGTTFTAAAVDDGTGPTMLGLGNRALTVPSVVFLSADGTFLFGEAADRRAATEPSRSAREFKRRIGDTVPILLAGQPFSPQALSAKLLAWTTSIATQRQGAAPDEVVVTYPANWGGYKRELLHQLVSLADLPSAQTCTEPEAAATQYASRDRLSPGDRVAVYDLGGGTFDVCILEKDETGFTILGSPDGVEHLGGIDFDEAVFQHVVGQLGDQLASLDPADPQVTDALARLRRECVDAKEALSSDVEAMVTVALPGLNTTVRFTRAELDGLITSPLRDTLDAMGRALRSANLTAADLTNVVLVGGSSRIPLVSHLLQSEFGVRTAMDTHPKHDVALGAVRYHQSVPGAEAPPAAATVAQWPTRGVVPAEEPAPVEEPAPDEPAAPPEIEVSEPTTQVQPVTPEATVEEKRTGPPIWTPPEGAAPPPGPSSVPAPKPGRRLPGKPVLAAAAAVVLVASAATAYVLTRGGSSATPVVARSVVVVPVVPAGGSDPALRQISTAQGSSGHDLGPVTGIPAGSQSLPSISHSGAWLAYRWGPPGSGPPSDEDATFRVVRADGSDVDLFTQPPSGVFCNRRLAWGPDDKLIAIPCHQAPAAGAPATPYRLYFATVGSDGQVDPSTLHQWSVSADYNPTSVSFTPDGHLVVSSKGGTKPGLYVGTVDGEFVQRTTGDDTDAVASPTSDLVAFVRDGDLYLAATSRSQQPPCPPGGTRSVELGTNLCDVTGKTTGPDAPNAPDAMVTDPGWSWNGQTIEYAIGNASTSELWLVTVSSGKATMLSKSADVWASSWGPR